MILSKKVFGASLLIAGTSIGAGMLALPVITSIGGFFPSLFVYVLCWAFMTLTGIFLMEVCLRMPGRTNIVSLSEKFLGSIGKTFAWIIYLILFYSLSVAYITVGASLFTEIQPGMQELGALFFVLFLAPFVLSGAKLVDSMNRWLMLGLIVTYLIFVTFGFQWIQLDRLLHENFTKAFFALPVIFTAFGFQGIVPSMTYYLDRDPQKIKAAIFFGTTAALVVYIIWQLLILGVVPLEGSHGLAQALYDGKSAIEPLQYYANLSDISVIGKWFSFFAITTSYLGVNLGLFDFLTDGLHLQKKKMGKTVAALAAFTPPLLVAMGNPNIFLRALGYAGGVGCALLLGLLPICMVWSARYHHRNKAYPPQFPGGRVLLSILLLFVLFEFVIEITQELSLFN